MTILLIIGNVLLKIIEVLLILLIIAVIIVCAVLFVPIRYSIDASFKEKREIFACVSWFFKVVNVTVSYTDDEFKYRTHIFGIDYNRIKKFTGFIGEKFSRLKNGKKKKDKKNSKEMYDIESCDEDDIDVSYDGDEKGVADNASFDEEGQGIADNADIGNESHGEDRRIVDDNADISDAYFDEEGQGIYDNIDRSSFDRSGQDISDKYGAYDYESEKYTTRTNDIENPDSGTDYKEETENESSEEDNIIRRFFSIIYNYIVEKLRNLYNGIKSIIELCRSGKEKLRIIIDFIRSDELSGMVCFTKDNVLHLLKKIKPKFLKGDIRFGTGDPCSTGELLGTVAVARGLFAFDINIVPDFEEKVFEGNVKAKGGIRISTLLIIIFKFITSDEWKQFNALLKKTKSSIKS